MSSDTFPPAEAIKSSIFVAHGSSKINAPASVAWDVLLSPSTWPDWNVFVPQCDGSTGRIKVGDELTFHVSMPPSPSNPDGDRAKNFTKVHVDLIEEPESGKLSQLYHVQWSRLGDWKVPGPLLRTERHLYVEATGDSQCEFRTYETFKGWAAYAIKFSAISDQVMTAFGEWAEGLKKASEQRFSADK